MANTHFFNPYNFVSTPPRGTSDDFLGDGAPRGHSKLENDAISGTLVVRMKAETPLIVPSSDVQTSNGHKTKRTRTKKGEPTPLIPPSSIKGMIRSSYEMVTNSRYAVFTGHDERLGMREATGDALLAIPAIVTENSSGVRVLRLLLGNKALRDLNTNKDGYLTWATGGNWDKCSLGVRVNMREVAARNLGRGIFGMVWFRYDPETMKVIEIRKIDDDVDSTFLQGYVHATGIPGSTNGSSGLKKGNERIFFAARSENQLDIPLTEEISKYWKDVIRDSVSANEKVEDKYRPLYVQEKQIDDWRDLNSFDTCYARVKKTGDVYRVELVQPVHIGRELHPLAPSAVLDTTLQPATNFTSFSPAERMFGWATDGRTEVPRNQSAYAGHVRFDPVISLSAESIQQLGAGETLAILNSPKPSMARFYAGVRDQVGEVSFKKGTPKKAALYTKGTTLRGRKVYPHHGAFDPESSSWKSRTKSKTNQTILDWIRAGSEFEFTIHVRNISSLELGALITSIETKEGECHRLGGGRPLGFGAVSLAIDHEKSHLSSTNSQVKSWESLGMPDGIQQQECESYAAQFVERVKDASFFKTFKAYVKGYANDQGIAVTYPRTSSDSLDSESILKWFQENERLERGNVINGYPLPQIGATVKNALPYLRRPQQQNRNSPGHQGRR